MRKRAQYEIPAGLKQAQERFAEWRSSHAGRRPIPEPLWALAGELAGAARSVSHGSGTSSRLHQAEATHAGCGASRETTHSAGGGVRGIIDARLAARVRMHHRSRRAARPHAHRMERPHRPGPGWSESRAVGARRLIQITPQIRILVAVEPIDARKGIDSLAQLCREKLATDPFSGCLFIFRSRRGTAIKLLAYDGQGFWLATKRLSKGRFRWWPTR